MRMALAKLRLVAQAEAVPCGDPPSPGEGLESNASASVTSVNRGIQGMRDVVEDQRPWPVFALLR